MKQDTVGKISSELIQKQPDTTSPIEQMRESLTDWDKNIYECIERSKKDFLGDFYVVVITKNEPLMRNVFRNYFYARLSCPTPDYDQTVYKYDRKTNNIDLIWVIPSRDASYYLKDNALQVSKEEYGLLRFVMEFANGNLFKKAKELNGEKLDSPLLER